MKTPAKNQTALTLLIAMAMIVGLTAPVAALHSGPALTMENDEGLAHPTSNSGSPALPSIMEEWMVEGAANLDLAGRLMKVASTPGVEALDKARQTLSLVAARAPAGMGKFMAQEKANLELAEKLMQTPPTPDDGPLSKARRAWSLASSRAPAGMEKQVAQQDTSFELAEKLIKVSETLDGLEKSIVSAKLATAWQAKNLGMEMPAVITTPSHTTPSAAIFSLVARHGAVAPDLSYQRAVADLDALPAAKAKTLTGIIDSFMAMQDAAGQAYAHVDMAKLQTLIDSQVSSQATPAIVPNLKMLEVDLGPVFTARNQFLDATLAFSKAWSVGSSVPSNTMGASGPGIDLCPYIALDVVGTDTVYTANCTLIVDVGGNDTYLNNAGGVQRIEPDCAIAVPNPIVNQYMQFASALLDVRGDDRYTSGLACGINGGAVVGTGFLMDESGNDIYIAGHSGTNGGGDLGLGFLLDGGGSDTYTAGGIGTNGGGRAGTGFLLDQAGDDTYNAGGQGTNGGGTFGGIGFLVDEDGNDTYIAGWDGTNGGGALGGIGFLVDEGGNDGYIAVGQGTNGGGYVGTGFLLDQAGDDTYNAGGQGTNGGGALGGIGFLVDEGDNDRYIAAGQGTNGGGFGGVGFLLDQTGEDIYNAGGSGANGGGSLGSGFLLDGGGDDAYTADNDGTNGGGALGSGFLLDEWGNDTYNAGSRGANGGGSLGSGFLLDEGGNDTYIAWSVGANGGGSFGSGFLLDEGGNDTYAAGNQGTNGGGYFGAGLLIDERGNDTYDAGGGGGVNGGGRGGSGLLLDLGGFDSYQDYDAPSGTGIDKTVVPKGIAGAQVDTEPPIPLPVRCPSPSLGIDPDCHTVERCATGVGVQVDGSGPCEPAPDPCPTKLGNPGPGQLAVICGQPVPNPCPQGADLGTVAACGAGPACPSGLTSPPGPTQFAVVCGQGIPNLLIGLVPQCMDDFDNDGDGKADFKPMAVGGGDPQCTNPFDNSEGS